MTDPSPLPDRTVPLPPGTGDPGVTAAWAAHLEAGRLGMRPPPLRGADHGCAGLAAALGWAGAAGRLAGAVGG